MRNSTETRHSGSTGLTFETLTVLKMTELGFEF
jgi:hypothetical protein